jgi:hypothetical protein
MDHEAQNYGAPLCLKFFGHNPEKKKLNLLNPGISFFLELTGDLFE